MWITVVTVNWGRGYEPGEFKRNVLKVMNFLGGREHVVILAQEIDEGDAASEHDRFASMLEPRTKKVGWKTHEPIVLSPSFEVRRQRTIITMKSGHALGAPDGTGPVRFAVSCIARDKATGIELGFANTHPHRDMDNRIVQEARRRGEVIFRRELNNLYDTGTSTIWGGDMNDTNFPVMIRGENTAVRRIFDVIRARQHPEGARLDFHDAGTLQGTIDNHDPLWARYRVTTR